MLVNPAERFRTKDAQPLYIDLKKILLATDGSDASIGATKYAIALAKLFKAKVRAVFVNASLEMPEHTAQVEESGVEGLLLARMYAARNDICFEELIVHGNIANRLIAVTEEFLPDMIIMGNSEKSGLRRTLGSVVDMVMNATDIPVLVVRNE